MKDNGWVCAGVGLAEGKKDSSKNGSSCPGSGTAGW